MTAILPPTEAGIALAASFLADGAVVAFPTDTVYGVGVAASRADRLPALFELKDRPPDRRIPMLVAGLGQVAALGYPPGPAATALTAAFWPGALTVVIARADGGTQAFRAPDHPVALALIRAAGPIYATSANVSDQPDTLGADDVQIAFAMEQDALAAIVDGGPVPGGTASTVVDACTDDVRVLREGPITRDQLAGVVRLTP